MQLQSHVNDAMVLEGVRACTSSVCTPGVAVTDQSCTTYVYDIQLLTDTLPEHSPFSTCCIVLNYNDDAAKDHVLVTDDRIPVIFTTLFKDPECMYSGAPVWTNVDRTLFFVPQSFLALVAAR